MDKLGTILCDIVVTDDGPVLTVMVKHMTMEECEEMGKKFQEPLMAVFKEVMAKRDSQPLVILNKLTGEIKPLKLN